MSNVEVKDPTSFAPATFFIEAIKNTTQGSSLRYEKKLKKGRRWDLKKGNLKGRMADKR